MSQQIRFDDGAAYERMMGRWSRLAGDQFLDWLAPAPGLDWIDVGCGNGAFTELIVERTAPRSVLGFDPSPGQLDFARGRPAAKLARFEQGEAQALPVGDGMFDMATMALVIFFVPEPAKGVAEMARVLRPGGMAAAYAWDLPGGGFPLEPIFAELSARNLPVVRPPSPDAARFEILRQLWTGAGFGEIETTEIAVTRSFDDFDDFWSTALLSTTVKPTIDGLSGPEVDAFKRDVASRLATDSAGRIQATAKANAIKGRLPE